MNQLEKMVWSSAFTRSLLEWTEKRVRRPYTRLKDGEVRRLAIETADHVILEMRKHSYDDGSDAGVFHSVDDLEDERREWLDLGPGTWRKGDDSNVIRDVAELRPTIERVFGQEQDIDAQYNDALAEIDTLCDEVSKLKGDLEFQAACTKALLPYQDEAAALKKDLAELADEVLQWIEEEFIVPTDGFTEKMKRFSRLTKVAAQIRPEKEGDDV